MLNAKKIETYLDHQLESDKKALAENIRESLSGTQLSATDFAQVVLSVVAADLGEDKIKAFKRVFEDYVDLMAL